MKNPRPGALRTVLTVLVRSTGYWLISAPGRWQRQRRQTLAALRAQRRAGQEPIRYPYSW